MIRPLAWKCGRLAENPTGQIVTWNVGKRKFLADVTGCEYVEYPRGGYILHTRYFNGETGPDVCAAIVKVILPDAQDYQADEEVSK